jgi:hypothetical protein
MYLYLLIVLLFLYVRFIILCVPVERIQLWGRLEDRNTTRYVKIYVLQWWMDI